MGLLGDVRMSDNFLEGSQVRCFFVITRNSRGVLVSR